MIAPSNDMIGQISQLKVEAMREMDLMKNEIKVRADADLQKIQNTAYYMLHRFLKGGDQKLRIKAVGKKATENMEAIV